MTIITTPCTLGGKPRIAGRRIAVQHVVAWVQQGKDAAWIAEEFDLDPLDIQAALDYYVAHREAVERSIAEDEKALESL